MPAGPAARRGPVATPVAAAAHGIPALRLIAHDLSGAAAAPADVSNPIEAEDEAVDLNLLLLPLRHDAGVRHVTFSHPLVQAAVYEQLGPVSRSKRSA